MRPSTSAATRFRLLVAAIDSKGRFETLASDRQVVRLGTGVFRDGSLSESSMDLACRVLERMTSEYREFKVEAVRAVGTSALRDASNQVEFVARASAIMRTPLYVISGAEEARLVQRGVQARWPKLRKPRADRGHRRRQRPADPQRGRPLGRSPFRSRSAPSG